MTSHFLPSCLFKKRKLDFFLFFFFFWTITTYRLKLLEMSVLTSIGTCRGGLLHFNCNWGFPLFLFFLFSNMCAFCISSEPHSPKTHSVWQRWGIMKLDVVKRQAKVLSELLYYRTSVKVVISYLSGSLYVKIVFMWVTSWKENDKVISPIPGGEMQIQTISLSLYSSLLRILTF